MGETKQSCKWKSAKWLNQKRQDLEKKIPKVVRASVARQHNKK